MGIIEAFIPFFFVLIFIELGFAYAFKRDVYRLNDSIIDLSCGIISQITGLFYKFLGLLFYKIVYDLINIHTLFNAPTYPNSIEVEGAHWYQWPYIVWWALAFVAVDFFYYWNHRKSHEVNILWAGHVIHHSSEEYNLTVALRQSSLHGLFTWVFYIPLAFLGIPPEMFAACYAVNLIYQFWVHTRLIRWLGPLEYIFVTPSNHRVHHAMNPKYIDKNHGGVFIVWDILFGSFKVEEEEPVYGLTVPLNSWNPLWANAHTFAYIFQTAFKCRSILDGLRVIFGKPGWRPDYLGAPILPREPDPVTYAKYDVPLSGGLKWYSLLQFVALLGGAFVILTNRNIPLETKLLPGGFIILLLTFLSELMERKQWAFHTEAAKLIGFIVLPIVAYFAYPDLPRVLALSMLIAGPAFGLFSLVWLFRMRDQFIDKTPDIQGVRVG